KGLGDEVLRHVGLDLRGIQWQQESDTVHATDEAAQLVGVSRQYLSKMAREGKIPARRSGRDWLFYRSGLVEFFGPGRVEEPTVRYGANASRMGNVRAPRRRVPRSEEHTSELQSPCNLVCRLLLEKKKHYSLIECEV